MAFENQDELLQVIVELWIGAGMQPVPLDQMKKLDEPTTAAYLAGLLGAQSQSAWRDGESFEKGQRKDAEKLLNALMLDKHEAIFNADELKKMSDATLAEIIYALNAEDE